MPTDTPRPLTFGPIADVVATAIEVTQGTQNLANEMPLVEGRWTAVRVYVKTQDPAVGVANIKGGLGAWRDGQALGVVFADNAPIVARPDGGLRTIVDDSLLFWLPPDWRSGKVHLKAMVYWGSPKSVDEEPQSANNFIEADVEFHPAAPALIRLVPVHLHQGWDSAQADITYTYQGNVSDSLEVLLDVFRLLPVSEMYFDPSLEFLVSFLGQDIVAQGPVLPVGHSQGVEWRLDEFGQAQLPNAGITALKLLSPDYYQDWQWYGMVGPNVSMKLFSDPASSINISGISNGTTAYGRIEKTNLDQPLWWVRGGMTLAHEVAHNVMPGPDHVLCTGSEEAGGSLDPNYPYPYDDNPPKTCSMAAIDPDGYYGFDVYWSLWPYLSGPAVISNDPAAKAPNAGFPLMGYKRPHWADPYDYCKLLDGLGVPCDESAINISAAPRSDRLHVASRPVGQLETAARRGSRHPKQAARAKSGPYLLVGVLTDDSTGTATIVETMPLADAPRRALEDAEERRRTISLGGLAGSFDLTFEAEDGNLLGSYELVDLDPPHHEGPSASHLFTELVQVPAGAAFVRVRSGSNVVAERRISAGPPSVRLLSPNGGSISGSVELAWEAADPDGDALTFTVFYSPDAGATWNPIAVGLDSTGLRLQSTAGLAGSESAMFRVVASDGVNIAQDESDAPISIPQNRPNAYIFGPPNGATVQQGASVILLGGAFDMEDGADPAVFAFRWRSNIDGEIGVGREVMTRALSAGRHRITLIATDTSGSSGEYSVDIIIVESRLAGPPDAGERGEVGRRLGLAGESDGTRRLLIIVGAGLAAAAILLAVAVKRRMA